MHSSDVFVHDGKLSVAKYNSSQMSVVVTVVVVYLFMMG